MTIKDAENEESLRSAATYHRKKQPKQFKTVEVERISAMAIIDKMDGFKTMWESKSVSVEDRAMCMK